MAEKSPAIKERLVKPAKTKVQTKGATSTAVFPAPVEPAVRIPAVLNITITDWKKETPIHRVHSSAYNANQFNLGVKGNARFSPIKDAKGNPIPTLYGGDSFNCAAMETVFHDVPFVSGFKTYDKRKLDGQVYSLISSNVDLKVVDLSAIALRKLGIERKDLIDTEKDRYPDTRLWAQAIHQQYPGVQGLCWVSRQDDKSRALVLFGDRIDSTSLLHDGDSFSLLDGEVLYGVVLKLAEQIGVDIV